MTACLQPWHELRCVSLLEGSDVHSKVGDSVPRWRKAYLGHQRRLVQCSSLRSLSATKPVSEILRQYFKWSVPEPADRALRRDSRAGLDGYSGPALM